MYTWWRCRRGATVGAQHVLSDATPVPQVSVQLRSSCRTVPHVRNFLLFLYASAYVCHSLPACHSSSSSVGNIGPTWMVVVYLISMFFFTVFILLAHNTDPGAVELSKYSKSV